MKKILFSVLALAMAAFSFTSCEDVPAPYDDPNAGGGGEVVLPEGVLLDQSFTNSLGNFTSISASGSLKWYNDYSSAMVTGYQDFNGDGQKENQAGVTYLVSPEIDLAGVENAYITINHAIKYERSDINTNNTILISKDFSGDVNTATWEALTYNTDGLNANGSTFDFYEKSVNIPTSYMGSKIVIALRHTCNDTQSSTWEVKSLKVQKGQAPEETPDTPADGTYIDEAFSSSFGSFTVKTVKGNPWIIDYSTAKATGYDNASKTTTASASYIVSSPVNLSASKGAYITFEYILRYVTNYGTPVEGINNKVLITDNYTGDPSTTNWTDITGTLTEGMDWNTWFTYSANVPSSFIGKNNIVIALYYSCESSSGTWEVKNLKMKEGQAEEENPGEDPGDNPGTSGEGQATVTKSGNVITMVDPETTASTTTVTCDLNTYGWENATEPTLVTLSDGTTISFAQEGGNNAPKFYSATKGVRMYALNSMTVTGSKKIAKIVITCDSYNGDNYVGNDQLYTDIAENVWKMINDYTSNSGGTQVRVQKLEITYAE